MDQTGDHNNTQAELTSPRLLGIEHRPVSVGSFGPPSTGTVPGLAAQTLSEEEVRDKFYAYWTRQKVRGRQKVITALSAVLLQLFRLSSFLHSPPWQQSVCHHRFLLAGGRNMTTRSLFIYYANITISNNRNLLSKTRNTQLCKKYPDIRKIGVGREGFLLLDKLGATS